LNVEVRHIPLRIAGSTTSQAHLEFVRAVAGKDDVRVRVDETGQHNLAARVDLARMRVRQRKDVERIADREEGLTADRDRSAVDDREVALRRAALGRIARERQNLVRRVDDEVSRFLLLLI